MVAVTHSLSASAASALDLLREGLRPDDAAPVEQAHDWARGLYGERVLATREPTWSHALGMALIAASLRLDADTRLAALCFAVGDGLGHSADEVT